MASAADALGQLRDLFPQAEESALRGALDSCHGSLEEAAERLLSSAASSAGAAKGGGPQWSQLRDMFPGLDPDLLSRALEACGGSVARAAERLLDSSTAAVTPAQASSPRKAAPLRRSLLSSPRKTKAKDSPGKGSVAASPRKAKAKPSPRKPRPSEGSGSSGPSGSAGTSLPSSSASAGDGLVMANDVKLPLDKLAPPPSCDLPGAREFAWESLKTKATLQKNKFGPDSGSTWLWFLVADLEATRGEVEGKACMNVRIVGDKFQAGWLREPSQTTSAAALRKNHCSMLQCELDGTLSAYGLARRGTPEGFSHAWHYSDSIWTTGHGEASCSTSAASWTEVKRKDRWRVEIHMRWACEGTAKQERYFIVAEQRAEKLNPNQYATAMRGNMIPISSDSEGREVLQRVLEAYHGEASKSKKVSSGSLQRFLRKRSAPDPPPSPSKKKAEAKL